MNYKWEEKSIGEIAEVIGGGTPKTSNPEFWEGNIPWITPKDLSRHTERYISRGERNISEIGLQSSSAKLAPPLSINSHLNRDRFVRENGNNNAKNSHERPCLLSPN